MREMAFLSQDYMMFQPHHNNNNHDFNDDDHHHHQQQHHHHHHQDPSISLNILSSCPPQDFQGVAGVPSLAMMNRSMSFSGYQLHQLDHNTNHQDDVGEHENHDHGGGGGGGGGDQDELSDDGSQVLLVGPGGGEKKKRLNLEQVKTLEKHFEQGNKLEPERKIQLAKALNLQPRQVAIWFQNRRARWKTKQLEKDYSVLKRQFDSLKADNDSLLSQNKKLHAELLSLRNREPTEYGAINLNNADTKSYWSNNGSEISSDMNLNTNSRTVTPRTGSPLSSNKLQFPPNSFIPNTITQFLHASSSPKPELDLQCPKMDPQQLHDDTFCTMYGGAGSAGGGGGGGGGGGIENQPPSFWAWPENQQNLN